jgi:hypothetical protein
MTKAFRRRPWIVVAMLLALHGALVSQPGSDFARTWLLVHFGLFLLWQPFFSTRRRLEPGSAVLLLAIVAVTVYFVAGWMIVAWVLLLIGILGGRVFTTQAPVRSRFYLAAFAYLVTILLAWTVPHDLLEQGVPESVSIFARAILPWTLALGLLLPSPAEDGEAAQVFDFFYAVLVFQLGVVLVLGSIALMRFTDEQYFTAVALTAMGFGVALFVLAVLWNPLRGFGGLRTYFSRYLLSVGMPFELWMRRIAELAETESDPRRFLELSLAEIARLPWVRGGHWRSPDGEGHFGKPDGHASRFEQRGLELVFHTGFRLSPALLLHMRLLAQVVGQFYEGKRREKAERHGAYLEAVHETGARLTHDVKNLLQSLYALMSMAPRESTDGYAALLQRQLPQLTQRLRSTVEKLRVPEAQVAELPVAASEWCGGVERRLEGSGVAFRCTIEEDRKVPASLFDGFLDNALENARAKAHAQPGLEVAVAFAASAARLELAVCDSGHAVSAEVAQRLFHEPIERASGLGIGLYHAARQARAAGYRLELAANRDGEVCFRLSVEG